MRIYRTGKRRILLLVLLSAALLALGCACALRARTLAYAALDMRRERPAQEEQVSSFSLRSQMGMEQENARINGWMSVSSVQEASIRRGNKTLHACWYAPLRQKEGAPWALVLHGGSGTDHDRMLDVACELSISGYNVLLPDLYGHGRSGGRFGSLGIREAEDVGTWVDWILSKDQAAGIVIIGQDTGAVAALLAACDGLPEAVAAVCADSAYRSVEERAEQLMQERMGEVTDADRVLLGAAYSLIHGVSMDQGNLVQRAAQAEIPLLLIHGTGDQDVPAWHSEDIALAAGDNAQLLYIEGAANGMARYTDRKLYYDTLHAFLRAALEDAR